MRQNTATKNKTPVFNKTFFILIILMILSIFPIMAQSPDEQDSVLSDERSRAPVFFFAPLAEVSFYGRHGVAVGGGLSLGTDNPVSIGISGLYTIAPGMDDEDRIDMIELTVFTRFYLSGFFSRFSFFDRFDFTDRCIGPFLQINAGAAIYAFADEMEIPVDTGSLSLGFALGWRFPFAKYFYAEPTLRFGYPYIISAVVSVGVRL